MVAPLRRLSSLLNLLHCRFSIINTMFFLKPVPIYARIKNSVCRVIWQSLEPPQLQSIGYDEICSSLHCEPFKKRRINFIAASFHHIGFQAQFFLRALIILFLSLPDELETAPGHFKFFKEKFCSCGGIILFISNHLQLFLIRISISFCFLIVCFYLGQNLIFIKKIFTIYSVYL